MSLNYMMVLIQSQTFKIILSASYKTQNIERKSSYLHLYQ